MPFLSLGAGVGGWSHHSSSVSNRSTRGGRVHHILKDEDAFPWAATQARIPVSLTQWECPPFLEPLEGNPLEIHGAQASQSATSFSSFHLLCLAKPFPPNLPQVRCLGVGRAVCITLGKDLGERRICFAMSMKTGSAELGLSGKNRLTPESFLLPWIPSQGHPRDAPAT